MSLIKCLNRIEEIKKLTNDAYKFFDKAGFNDMTDDYKEIINSIDKLHDATSVCLGIISKHYAHECSYGHALAVGDMDICGLGELDENEDKDL